MDIAARSQQVIHNDGYGKGYRPGPNPPAISPRFTVTKKITRKNADTATVTLTVTCATNHAWVGTGMVLEYVLIVSGHRRGRATLKSSSASIDKNKTYTTTLIADVPLTDSSTQSADLRLDNSQGKNLAFSSRDQGGTEITGLPVRDQESEVSFGDYTVSEAAGNWPAKIRGRQEGATHDLTLRVNGYNLRTFTGYTVLDSITVTETLAGEILGAMSSQTSANAALIVTTKAGNKVIGESTYWARVTVAASVKPKIGGIGVTEADTTVAGAEIGAFVQGLSKLRIAMNNTAAGAGSYISSIKRVVDGREYWGTSPIEVPVKNSGTVKITATVTDARGRTATASTSVTVLAYTPPRVTVSSVRRVKSDGTPNPQGDHVRVQRTARITPLTVGGVQKNTLTVRIQARQVGASSWTSKFLNTWDDKAVDSGSNTIGVFYASSSWEILVHVQDKFRSAWSYHTIATGRVSFGLRKDEGIGAGKRPEAGALDVYCGEGGGLAINGKTTITVDDLLCFLNQPKIGG